MTESDSAREGEPSFEWRRGRTIPLREFRFAADTSGGPGGQHANRSATRITLSWRPGSSGSFSEEERARLIEAFAARLTRSGTLQIRSSGERSARRNRQECLDTLGRMLREALRPRRKRTKTRPTRGSVERRLSSKRKRAGVKSGRKKPSLDD